MIKITNLWIRTTTNNSDDYWYLDYKKGLASRHSEKPKHESIRKWNGSVVEFLTQRRAEIIEKSDDSIKFKPENIDDL